MKDFVEDLQKAISLEKIVSVIIPYEKITLKYLASVLLIESQWLKNVYLNSLQAERLRAKSMISKVGVEWY